jgi:hypothetical protein
MENPRVYEGTGEELEHYLKQAPKDHFRLILLSGGKNEDIESNQGESDSHVAINVGMLSVMNEISQRQAGRPYTDGSSSLQLLREARAGAMYGYDATDDK